MNITLKTTFGATSTKVDKFNHKFYGQHQINKDIDDRKVWYYKDRKEKVIPSTRKEYGLIRKHIKTVFYWNEI